jgi:hypothetical protein
MHEVTVLHPAIVVTGVAMVIATVPFWCMGWGRTPSSDFLFGDIRIPKG